MATVQAGGIRIGAVPIHTLDLASLPGFFGIDVKGIVGTRFLMHFLSTIDYPGGGLILRRDVSEQRQRLQTDIVGRPARSLSG